MKKLILCLIIFLSVGINLSAQNAKNDGTPYPYFCRIVAVNNLAGQLRVKVEWDNQKADNNLRDENGKKIEFTTMMDALNYFSKRGWEYVDCSFFGEGGKFTIHYLLRKMVTKDEEAKEGLYFENDFK